MFHRPRLYPFAMIKRLDRKATATPATEKITWKSKATSLPDNCCLASQAASRGKQGLVHADRDGTAERAPIPFGFVTSHTTFRTLSARRVGAVAFRLEKIPGVRHFVDRRFDDHRARLIKRPTQGLRKSLRPFGASCVRAEALSEAHEIWVLQVGRDDPTSIEILLHAPHIAVTAI